MITSAAAPFSLRVRFETGLYCYRFNAPKQIIMAPVKTHLGATHSMTASSAVTKLLNVPVTQICITILLNSKRVSKHS